MSLPAFNAANSLYRTTNSYRSVFFSDLPTRSILSLASVPCHMETCKRVAARRYKAAYWEAKLVAEL
jgi:hypothetical protein